MANKSNFEKFMSAITLPFRWIWRQIKSLFSKNSKVSQTQNAGQSGNASHGQGQSVNSNQSAKTILGLKKQVGKLLTELEEFLKKNKASEKFVTEVAGEKSNVTRTELTTAIAEIREFLNEKENENNVDAYNRLINYLQNVVKAIKAKPKIFVDNAKVEEYEKLKKLLQDYRKECTHLYDDMGKSPSETRQRRKKLILDRDVTELRTYIDGVNRYYRDPKTNDLVFEDDWTNAIYDENIAVFKSALLKFQPEGRGQSGDFVSPLEFYNFIYKKAGQREAALNRPVGERSQPAEAPLSSVGTAAKPQASPLAAPSVSMSLVNDLEQIKFEYLMRLNELSGIESENLEKVNVENQKMKFGNSELTRIQLVEPIRQMKSQDTSSWTLEIYQRRKQELETFIKDFKAMTPVSMGRAVDPSSSAFTFRVKPTSHLDVSESPQEKYRGLLKEFVKFNEELDRSIRDDKLKDWAQKCRPKYNETNQKLGQTVGLSSEEYLEKCKILEEFFRTLPEKPGSSSENLILPKSSRDSKKPVTLSSQHSPSSSLNFVSPDFSKGSYRCSKPTKEESPKEKFERVLQDFKNFHTDIIEQHFVCFNQDEKVRATFPQEKGSWIKECLKKINIVEREFDPDWNDRILTYPEKCEIIERFLIEAYETEPSKEPRFRK